MGNFIIGAIVMFFGTIVGATLMLAKNKADKTP